MDMNYRGGLWEGEDGQDGVKEGKWDNCNSIINKYIFKNQKKIESSCFCMAGSGKLMEKVIFK